MGLVDISGMIVYFHKPLKGEIYSYVYNDDRTPTIIYFFHPTY